FHRVDGNRRRFELSKTSGPACGSVVDISEITDEDELVLQVQRQTVWILELSIVALDGAYGFLSTGSLLPVNHNPVVALDGHVEQLLLLIRRHLERMAGNVQRAVRRHISARVRRKDRHPVLCVAVEGVDLLRL